MNESIIQITPDLAIQDTETDEDYQFRISQLRDAYGWTWFDVADIINSQTGNSYSESKYRKDWKNYVRGYDSARHSQVTVQGTTTKSNEVDEYTAKLIELKKERVKLSDERTQANAYIRQLAREETIKEIALEVASKMNTEKQLLNTEMSAYALANHENEAILVLSDWHYGIVCDNYWNQYDPEIAKVRISHLLASAKHYCRANDVSRIHVVNLADLICGRIHYTLRLESRFDVITQIMEVSEILSEFLNDLSQEFEVDYYDCLDNHSRLEPNKKDAMDLESLARITPWYLKTRLGDKIVVHENEYDPEIITFDVLGFNIIAVHGDKDNPSTVVDKLSLMTGRHYDMVLTAHLHHFSADEKNKTLVVSNGSLMGTDTYAKNLRLSSEPSQNLVIVSPNNVAEAIYRICVE